MLLHLVFLGSRNKPSYLPSEFYTPFSGSILCHAAEREEKHCSGNVLEENFLECTKGGSECVGKTLDDGEEQFLDRSVVASRGKS